MSEVFGDGSHQSKRILELLAEPQRRPKRSADSSRTWAAGGG